MEGQFTFQTAIMFGLILIPIILLIYAIHKVSDEEDQTNNNQTDNSKKYKK